MRCPKISLKPKKPALEKERRTSLASDQATLGDAQQSMLASALMALPVIVKFQRRRSAAAVCRENEARELRKQRARQSVGIDSTIQNNLLSLIVSSVDND